MAIGQQACRVQFAKRGVVMVRLASKLTLLISSLFLFGCGDPQQKNMGTLLGSGDTQSESNPFTPVEKKGLNSPSQQTIKRTQTFVMNGGT
ncbi:hypothetical protein QW180_23560 [Vibrio sinaloensis]|nr:hypothetical protein [Vibrio sinaloensis]